MMQMFWAEDLKKYIAVSNFPQAINIWWDKCLDNLVK